MKNIQTQTLQCKQLSICFNYCSNIMIFVKSRFQFKTETLRLKPTKTCYWCMKTLDDLLIMIYELVETKIKSK
jgi:hypothetical protein